MSDGTSIEWCDASWNPLRVRNRHNDRIGWHCEHLTTGCENCYAEGFNLRLGTGLPFKPGHRKDVRFVLDDKTLTQPLRWKRPRRVFVCSMTDLFADFVEDAWIDRVFAIMALAPQHQFQVLTKRAERMRVYMTDRAESPESAWSRVWQQQFVIEPGTRRYQVDWPFPNVWLGVSAERQEEADARIPHLLQTPAAVRFVSAEPLLGPIDLNFLNSGDGRLWNALTGSKGCDGATYYSDMPPQKLDWLIVGGESGPKARPMETAWAESIRDQCRTAGVAFFMKQMAKKSPIPEHLFIREMPTWAA